MTGYGEGGKGEGEGGVRDNACESSVFHMDGSANSIICPLCQKCLSGANSVTCLRSSGISEGQFSFMGILAAI